MLLEYIDFLQTTPINPKDFFFSVLMGYFIILVTVLVFNDIFNITVKRKKVTLSKKILTFFSFLFAPVLILSTALLQPSVFDGILLGMASIASLGFFQLSIHTSTE